MSKNNDFNEESDDFLENEDGNLEFISDDESNDIEDIIIDIDDDNIDIVIEVSEDDEFLNESKKEKDVDDVILSKHKIQGKHSLKYDSIFKGKKETTSEEEDVNTYYHNDKFELDKGTSFYSESYDNETYLRHKRVKERVYEVLSSKTNLNFMNNRRKPSRVDFNKYYLLLTVELNSEKFTNVEIFNELSVYFSDNLFNMFKLLDNKWRNMIISELQEHIGKNTNSKEVTNRNIHIGTELEFEHMDIVGESRLYTGVVVETDYVNSFFKIDSYENVYEVHITSITRILNNTKFKHNLNKLDNIDFL